MPTSCCCSRPAPTISVGGSCHDRSTREGKAGYLRWKRDQRQRHADDVADLLAGCHYAADEIAQVQAWVRRDQLATDPGSQAVEDAACLVFIETQLASVADKLDHDHLVDVIRKTAKKMSPAALDAVSRIPLGRRRAATAPRRPGLTRQPTRVGPTWLRVSGLRRWPGWARG